MEYTFFVDESGHAGINYLDNRQPDHVAAGILISKESEAELRNVLASDSGEFKGRALLTSSPGRRRAIETLLSAQKLDARWFWVLMDREFSIAGKIVDVFLDPRHNSTARWLPPTAFAARKEIAADLAKNLNQATLHDFARAYRAPRAEDFRKILERLVHEASALGRDRLAKAFKGAIACVDQITEAETYGGTDRTHADLGALNLPCLCHLLRLVDRFVDGRGKFSTVHDNNVQFQEIFQSYIAEISRHQNFTADVVTDDGSLFRPFLQNHQDFRMVDSKDEAIVQLADIVAAAVTRLAKNVRSRDVMKDDIKKLASLLTPFLLYESTDHSPHFAAAFADDDLIAGLILAGIPNDRQRQL